jgi:16S rRNA (cytidine1402-2'-O)-methyltransferase
MSKLYLVSIHIGNVEDITFRAVNILKTVKNIVCEDYKIGKRIIREYNLGEKNLMRINVKSRDEDINEILNEYLLKGEDIALFSDTGTPVFADPGFKLSKRAYNLGIEIIPIPGASSLMAAIVKSDIEIKRFYYYGFLSAKRELRDKELRKLKKFPDPIIFLEAPYRLAPLLEAIKRNIGNNRYINVICELTTPQELIIKGSVKKVYEHFRKTPFKGEFVVILDSE